ncbi:putative oxidoreductase [Jackrogersella minutella]|nr:putative oxidoreductase [Jackrogersella minutella]
MVSSTSISHCEALIALLGKEKVSLPGSTAYNASLLSYFSLQSIAVHPLCIVSPQSASDVSAVIGSLTSANAPNGSCEFAIRSGGHMWFPGASNAPNGVTIDLRGLNSIDLNADNSTVSAGAGATWDAVYGNLDPLGLSVAGGRIAGVGVGGLTLGGGISYFGPRYGWTCNTASAFEIVLADGSIVEATEKQNSDLFHGLCGGSNNFGVVTRIDLKTFNQGPIWYGSTYNPLSTIDDQVRIYAKIVAAENYDENASFITGFGFSKSQGLTVITNELAYTKPVEGPPSYYEELLSLPSIYNSSSTVSAQTLAQNGASFLPPGANRYLFATVTFRPTEAMLHAAFDAWNASLAGVQDINGLTWSLSLEALPPALYRRGAAANAMGLGDRTGTRVVCLLSHIWADEADNERVYAATAALVSTLQDAARSLDAYDPFIYLNYAAPWQEPIASYGDESVQKLRELRARVDPKGVFTHLVPGGFKIPPDDTQK